MQKYVLAFTHLMVCLLIYDFSPLSGSPTCAVMSYKRVKARIRDLHQLRVVVVVWIHLYYK